MGASSFITIASGSTASKAFKNAVDSACYCHGHSGYTGTIAEKDSFTIINKPDGVDLYEYIDKLFDDNDSRISDKWGDAGCIQIEEGKYCFFGFASC